MGHALDSSTPGQPTGTTPRSTRSPAGAGRSSGWLRSTTLLGLAASACVGLLTLPGTASADPRSDLTQKVADANHQLEVLSERVNQAQVDLQQQQAAAQQADQAAAAARDQLKAMQGKVAQLARTAYTTGDVSRLDALLTSHSADDFLAQMGTLDVLAGHQTQVLSQAVTTAKTAQKARATAESAAAAAKSTLDGIASKQSQLQVQLADYKKQYAALTAPQQQAVVQAVSGKAVPVQAPAAPVVANSAAAQTAVNTALAQVGKPYVWGASGPNSFDCSGLTMYSYAAAGVSLPHSSSGQSTMGTPVSRDQLQPGDLVFFYSPVSHVGMYIGNGEMVHASTEGTPVQVVSLDSMPGYNSARRLG
jgi:cell wall-associated NlpC family hydrolase